MGEVIARF